MSDTVTFEIYPHSIIIPDEYRFEKVINDIKKRIKPLEIGDKIIELECCLRENSELHKKVDRNLNSIPDYAKISKTNVKEFTIKLPPGVDLDPEAFRGFKLDYDTNNIYKFSLYQIEDFLKEEIKFIKEQMQYKILNNRVPIEDTHVKQSKPNEKIQWQGTQKELVDIFNILDKKGKLSNKQAMKKWALISDHFENSDGTPMRNTTLEQTDKKIYKKNGKAQKNIDDLVNDIKKALPTLPQK